MVDSLIRRFCPGLYICKTLVEANQGRIWVESELGQGCKFHLIFPAASAPGSIEG